MKDKSFFSMIIAIALLVTVLVTVACTTESERTEPITTTTDKGTSSAPSAKEAEKRDRTEETNRKETKDGNTQPRS
jgi:hypothetical protein